MKFKPTSLGMTHLTMLRQIIANDQIWSAGYMNKKRSIFEGSPLLPVDKTSYNGNMTVAFTNPITHISEDAAFLEDYLIKHPKNYLQR